MICYLLLAPWVDNWMLLIVAKLSYQWQSKYGGNIGRGECRVRSCRWRHGGGFLKLQLARRWARCVPSAGSAELAGAAVFGWALAMERPFPVFSWKYLGSAEYKDWWVNRGLQEEHLGLTVMKEIYGHITESKTTVSVAKRVCKDKKFKLILKSMLSRGIRFQI